jgi:photosystem II stability/assembly factor-like uncharacterized protein
MTAAALLACAAPVAAHDPSAWGGMFRSRDDGAAWISADAGLFVGAALALAVSPSDPNHLLYGTDTALLRSRNGGRDWAVQAPNLFNGPTLALAFSADGKGAWAATPAGVFSSHDDASWAPSSIAAVAIPARALAPSSQPGRAYLLGARGVFASADGGRSFSRIGQGDLPDAAGRALLVTRSVPEALLVVIDGRVWLSSDAGQTWAPRDAGLPHAQTQVLALDRSLAQRLWAASARQLHVSDDLGATWRAHGQPIAEAALTIHGLAVARDGARIVLTTHKGLQRSVDGGASWAQAEGALPVHLEAGPLVADPHDAQTLYAGFALVPYAELRRRAEQGTNLVSQLDPVSVAGAAAFLLLLLIGGSLGARKLARVYRDA